MQRLVISRPTNRPIRRNQRPLPSSVHRKTTVPGRLASSAREHSSTACVVSDSIAALAVRYIRHIPAIILPNIDFDGVQGADTLGICVPASCNYSRSILRSHILCGIVSGVAFVAYEPSRVGGFHDRRLKPLGHPPTPPER